MATFERNAYIGIELLAKDKNAAFNTFKQKFKEVNISLDSLESKNLKTEENYVNIFSSIQKLVEKAREVTRAYKGFEELIQNSVDMKIDLNIEANKFLELISVKPSKEVKLFASQTADIEESQLLCEKLEDKRGILDNSQEVQEEDNQLQRGMTASEVFPRKYSEVPQTTQRPSSLTRTDFMRSLGTQDRQLASNAENLRRSTLVQSFRSSSKNKNSRKSFNFDLKNIKPKRSDEGLEHHSSNGSLHEDAIIAAERTRSRGLTNPNSASKLNVLLRNNSKGLLNNTSRKTIGNFAINPNFTSVTNMTLDRQSFVSYLQDFFISSRKMERVNFYGDTFEFEPIQTIKETFKKPLPNMITIDLRKSKMNQGIKKEGIPKLVSYNIKVIIWK